MWLARAGASEEGATYQVGDHDFALTTSGGRARRSGLAGLLGLLGGLLDTANGSGGSSRAAGIGATTAAALASRLLPRADDRLKRLVQARFRHGGWRECRVGGQRGCAEVMQRARLG